MSPRAYTILLLGAVLLCASLTLAEKTDVPCWKNDQCSKCSNTGRQNADTVCCQGCASAGFTMRGGDVCTCYMDPSYTGSATNWVQSVTRMTWTSFAALTGVMLLTR